MYNWIVKRPETAAAIYEAVNAGTCTTLEHVAAIAAAYKDDVFWTGSLPTGNRGEDSLDEAASEILRELGIPAHVLGYRYVREAITLSARDAFPSFASVAVETIPRFTKSIFFRSRDSSVCHRGLKLTM